MENFKARYLAGEIEFEAIDDYVDEWNNGDDPRTLAQFLGLDEEEEMCIRDRGTPFFHMVKLYREYHSDRHGDIFQWKDPFPT